MSELRDFVADLLECKGAAVEALDPDGLEVLTPAPLQKAMGWPELARLGFATKQTHGVIQIGLEDDWLDRFGALLGDKGRWSEREVKPAGAVATILNVSSVLPAFKTWFGTLMFDTTAEKLLPFGVPGTVPLFTIVNADCVKLTAVKSLLLVTATMPS